MKEPPPPTESVDKPHSFEQLGVCTWLVDAVNAMRITAPTPIQVSCIPPILEGRNCIGGAKTGSGKTIAFALPILQKWSQDPYGVFALILTPTRELALQIDEQIAALGAPMNLKHTLVVGGYNMLPQALDLSRKPHIVIATPGRLADHIQSSGSETWGGLQRAKFLVLDEADRLLQESFSQDLDVCMSVLPEPTQRQTLLFTATITDAVTHVKKRAEEQGSAHRPFFHHIDEGALAVPITLQQYYLFIPAQVKEAYLVTLLLAESNAEKSALVFVNRTHTAEVLGRVLRSLEVRSTSLHSRMSQRDRADSLGRFRAEAARVLVSTDVSSRGLDIPAVEMIVNFDLPNDPNDYIHRVGRTARAGRKGQSVSFVSQRDVLLVESIEKRVGKRMDEYKEIPESKVIKGALQEVSTAKREAVMAMDKEQVKRKRKLRAG